MFFTTQPFGTSVLISTKSSVGSVQTVAGGVPLGPGVGVGVGEAVGVGETVGVGDVVGEGDGVGVTWESQRSTTPSIRQPEPAMLVSLPMRQRNTTV